MNAGIRFISNPSSSGSGQTKASTVTAFCLRLIALSLLAMLSPAFAAPSFAEGLPDRIVSANALRVSAYAERFAREATVTVTGMLTVLHKDDLAAKRSEFLYSLKESKTGKTYRLRFGKKAPPYLISGAIVKARGRIEGQELYLALDITGQESIQTIPTPQVAVSGEQKTLVIMADFLDASVSCSIQQVEDLMFTDPAYGSVDDYYQETSSGNVWFSGDVVGPYTIDYTSTDACNIGAWADDAEAAARAGGIDTGQYTRKIYVLPSKNGCGSYAGIGQVGGSPSRAWVFYCDIEDLYAHELGHNLGMYHASSPNSEYGDGTDIMGAVNNGLRHLNPAHQDQMGWRPPVMNVLISESGIYDIAPQELYAGQATAPQILRIAKPDTGEFYYIAYRRPLGFDTNLQWWHQNVVTVHRYKGADGLPTNTYLLDALETGDSFADSINNITVSHLQQNQDYATVQIALNGSAACTAGPPAIDLSPASRSAEPGGTLSYTVSVTSTDSLNCAAARFSLSHAVPSGWTGSLSTDTLTLSPGQNGTATLSVSSAATAAAADYLLQVDVAHSAAPEYRTTAQAIYVVQQGCILNAPIIGISPASQSAAPGTTLTYGITVSNTDNANCTAGAFFLDPVLPEGWTGSAVPGTLDLLPGQSGTATLSVTSSPGTAAGDYLLGVDVSGAAGSAHSALAGASYVVEAVDGVAREDTEPPTVPANLCATVKNRLVKLSWDAASDNVGVSGYVVWRDGVRVAEITATAYSDSSSLSGGTYSVTALDAAGNMSGHSNTVFAALAEKTNQGKPKK